jgi:hypothetical protein
VDELRRRIAQDVALVNEGGRPIDHVTTTYDGAAVDVRITELPLIHLFVPDASTVLDGARGLIAQTLQVDPTTFDVVVGG